MIFTCLLGLIALQIDTPVQVEFSDGNTTSTNLKSVESKRIQFTKPESLQDFKQIANIRFNRPLEKNSPNNAIVFCLGKTILHGKSVVIKDGSATLIDSDGNNLAKFPRSYLRSIKLDPKLDSKRWNQINEKMIESDALAIERDGRIDLLDGVVKAMNDEEVTFDIRGRSANVKLSKLVGIRFFQTEDKHKPPFEFLDVHRNRIFFDDLMFDGESLVLFHQEHKIEVNSKLAHLINFSAGNFSSLAELSPQSTNWIPFLKAKTKDPQITELIEAATKNKKLWTRNESFGKPIMMDFESQITKSNPAGRVVYKSGISVLGGSELVYSIPDGATAFEADLGIQSSDNDQGDVAFQILVDGKPVYQKRVKATDDSAHQINVPVQGNRITFKIGYGQENNVGDVISLGNPRFRKQ